MTVTATYTLYIDWNNNGSFNDAGEDISNDLISAVVTRGFADGLARVAQTGRLTVVLDNKSQNYSPPQAADARPWRPIRLDISYGGATTELFVGYLDTIRPSVGRFGLPTATLTACDVLRKLERSTGAVSLRSGVWADDIISDTVAAVYTPAATDYESGINYFPTSAPNWFSQESGALTEEVRAVQKIVEACGSDWGRFYIAADGTPTYRNRQHIPLDSTVWLALDNDMLSLSYQQSANDILNEVNVTVYPRTVGSSYEVLGRLEQFNAARIEASDDLLLTLHLRDPGNSQIAVGGKDLVTPAATTDYYCTKDEGGEGADETANVTISAIEKFSDRAKITLTNASAYPVYVQRLHIRGIAVRAREPVTVTKTSAGDGNPLSLRAPLLSETGAGELLAAHILARRESAIHDIRNVQIVANESGARMVAVGIVELLRRVTLTEAQTGLSAFAGYIYALEHHISRAQHLLVIHVGQQYLYASAPFVIGDTLDSGHILIY